MHVEWYTLVVLITLGFIAGTIRQKRADGRPVSVGEWAWLGLNLGSTLVWALPALWPQ